MTRHPLILVLALALAVTAVACGDAATDDATSAAPVATPAETAMPGSDVDGAAVFADNCSGCHGADGSGGSGPDLREEDDAAEIRGYVENGYDSMPAFGDTLSAAEIDAVAGYVAGGLQ